jgi:alkylation response protein AidB-like acyl-CoA dehydrogenase
MRVDLVEMEARFHPTSDQLALGGTITESLDELLPLSRLHAAHHESSATWASLDDIGVFTIGLSETSGGSGLGAVEEALIVMGLGRRLAAPGLLATIGAAQMALGADVPGLRGKRVAAAYRHVDRIIVVEEGEASFILLRDANGAALHESKSSGGQPLDSRLWAATLREEANLGKLLAKFEPLQVARLRLLDAAALAGMAEATLDMGVAYAGMRQQFGRPIGAFQAVKHHCANMAIAARCARDQTNFAAVALDQGRADALLQVECAFYVAGSAALENASKNIQIHGGMGFSDEADPHLFLKRAQLAIAIAGGLDAANNRIASTKADW